MAGYRAWFISFFLDIYCYLLLLQQIEVNIIKVHVMPIANLVQVLGGSK